MFQDYYSNTYTDIVRRMRWAQLTDSDIKILNSRIDLNPRPAINAVPKLYYCPFITPLNVHRSAINLFLTHSVARQQKLIVYAFKAKKASNRGRLNHSLLNLNETITSKVPFNWEYHLGMPITITRKRMKQRGGVIFRRVHVA